MDVGRVEEEEEQQPPPPQNEVQQQPPPSPPPLQNVINLVCITQEEDAERQSLRQFFSETANHFLCVVCERIPRPSQMGKDILTCPGDHIVCVSCRLRLINTNCPKCRVPISGEIKNVLLKTIFSRVLEYVCYKCKYVRCNAMLKQSEVLEHELVCDRKPSLCPTCWRDFDISSGIPCCPYRVAVYDRPSDQWKHTVLLSEIYDSERNALKNVFMPVNLFLDGSAHVTRFFLCAFYDTVSKCLNFSPVLLEDKEDSHLFLQANVRFLVIRCYVNVGFGSFKVGHALNINYQDKYKNFDSVSSLKLYTHQVSHFFKKALKYRCVECDERRPHVHFEVTFGK